MEHEKIERLNELARKKKTMGLTKEEFAEQDALRKEYLDGFRENMKQILVSVVVREADGSEHPLEKKKIQ